MAKIYFCVIASLILCYDVIAQLNDSSNHHITYQTSGSWNKSEGNSLLIVSNNLKFSVRKKHVIVNVYNNWLYGAQRQNLVNNDFSSALDFNLYKTWKRFNYWGLATYDRSYSLKIRNRYQFGFGGAYDLVDKDQFAFNVSNGIIYEQSNISTDADTNSFNSTFRNSLRLRYKLTWNERFIVEGTHFLQNAFSTRRDYIIKSNSTFFIRIAEWIYLTGSLVYNRLNISGRENLITTYGVSMEKSF